MRRLELALLLGCLVGCQKTGCQPAVESKPPGPATSADLPSDFASGLPVLDSGLPVLIASNGGGIGLVLAYDQTLDDPIARWGECLSRVTACYRANGSNPIAGCIDQIERCADDRGGKGCCPTACVDEFHRLDGDLSEDDAVTQSFGKGDCVAGFAAQRDGVQP